MIIRSRSQALDILELDHDAPDELIRSTYKRMLMEHHPDRGGDAGKFDNVCRARSFLLRKVCTACGGSKMIRTQNGRASTVKKCTECV